MGRLGTVAALTAALGLAGCDTIGVSEGKGTPERVLDEAGQKHDAVASLLTEQGEEKGAEKKADDAIKKTEDAIAELGEYREVMRELRDALNAYGKEISPDFKEEDDALKAATKVIVVLDRERRLLQGRETFRGIGVHLSEDKESGAIAIKEALEGFPAMEAGVRSGDRLLAVDGVEVTGMGSRSVPLLLRGKGKEEKSSVTLDLDRKGERLQLTIPLKTMRFVPGLQLVEEPTDTQKEAEEI